MTNNSTQIAEIIDNVRRFFQFLNEHSKQVERETGLTGSQLWAIKVIADNEPIKPSDLAKRMYLHPATVVGLIDRLVLKDLVSRTRPERDRRTVEIALTGAGRELLFAAPEVPQDLLTRGLENLSPARLARIADGIGELVKIMGAEGLAPQLILSSQFNLPEKESA